MGSTERFGYEWNRFKKIIPEYEKQFLGWVTPLQPEDFKGKRVLDAGCGTGRNSYWPLRYGAKEVVAFDFDKRTVKVARNNLSQFPNATVRYQSIYDIPEEGHFDISFSIGVIHHLEDPLAAVRGLSKATKKGGKVLIWVYGYEGNEWIVRYVNPVRKVTSRLPIAFTHLTSYACSIPLYLYLRLPQKKPYLRQLKAFRFWHVHSIVFDQLLPRIAHYWTREEAMSLLSKAGLKDVEARRVNKVSWAVMGRKG